MGAIPSRHLNTGASIPQVGFGLWQVKNEAECVDSVNMALAAGYRHFDTAQAYGNEQYLGAALKQSAILRSELFITTKIGVQNFGRKHTPKSFALSLEKLQLDYVDLLLLHFPVTLLRGKSWKALEAIHASGQAKAIGVSNYTIKHLEDLLADCSVVPAVNQVELHVFLQQPELVAYCQAHNIVVEAYSPLAHGKGMDDPELVRLGQKYQKTPGQIMLRWCIEQGTVPLPKSVHKERIDQNIALFDFAFDQEDIIALKALNKNMRTCWDPTHVP
jgi:diketogulonate reductase-like aldo/keto reductase